MRSLSLAVAAALALGVGAWWFTSTLAPRPPVSAAPTGVAFAAESAAPAPAAIAEGLRSPVAAVAEGRHALSWTRERGPSGAATFEVRVRDSRGAPIVQAFVTAHARQGQSFGNTDDEGSATLPWTKDLRLVEVYARGFARSESAPPESARALEVVLQPTNRLTIEVLEVDGTPWADGLVELKLGAGDRVKGNTPGLHLLRPGSAARVQARGRRRSESLQWRTDAQGRIELEQLATERGLALIALDELAREGARVEIPPLAAREQRTQRVQLTNLSGRIHGRVADLGGRPIGGALVELVAGDERTSVTSDGQGEFRTPPLFAGPVDVLVSAPGRSARQESVDPSDGRRREFRLAPGRDLTVWLRDPRNKPLALGSLEVLDVHGAPVPCRRQDGGSFVDLRNLPREPLELLYRFRTRSMRRSIDAQVERVEWNLPEPGTLDARIAFGPGAAGGTHRLRVIALEAADATEHVDVQPGGIREVRLPLWPGHYRLEVVDGQGQPSFAEPTTTVVLLAGATTHAVLGP